MLITGKSIKSITIKDPKTITNDKERINVPIRNK